MEMKVSHDLNNNIKEFQEKCQNKENEIAIDKKIEDIKGEDNKNIEKEIQSYKKDFTQKAPIKENQKKDEKNKKQK